MKASAATRYRSRQIAGGARRAAILHFASACCAPISTVAVFAVTICGWAGKWSG
jgi:hypothetical protein